jgi:alpha-D-xyloside xylohydrolase
MGTVITRRALAKSIAAASTGLGFSRIVSAEGTQPAPAHAELADWKEIYPGVWRATLGTPEDYTPVSSRMVDPKTAAYDKLPSVKEAPLPSIRGRRIPRGFVAELPLRPGEEIYGFGLQFLSFAQRGKKKKCRVNADPRQDTGDSNAPVPFYVTTKGIGVLVDTARYADFYFGDARPKPTKPMPPVDVETAGPNYTHTVPAEAESSITVDVPHVSGVDVYLFAGPTMVDAVRRYNVFSGGGLVPPEWGLGLWYRMIGSANEQDFLHMARELRDRKIPCDVIGLEPGWQTHAYSCTFAWSPERFPDPQGLIHAATEMSYKVNLWEHAFTNPSSPLFSKLEPYSGNYGVWGGLVPDFAGSRGREIFGDYHGTHFVDAGISGFKLDECDNSDYTGGWSFPECSSFPSGIDGEQMHSVFGLRYQKTIWQEYQKRQKPTYNLVRSSGALAAPYPFVLYSDLYDHRQYIRVLVNSGFSGLLWCPEVRQAVSVEDLIRRLQSTVFSPLAHVDGCYMKHPVWKQFDRAKNDAGDLLENWESLEARCREIINWRMQLVPYLTVAFERYAEDGTPPFRALVLDSPNDRRLRTVDDQYMVGDRMMVAPLFAGEPGRKVVMPQGEWHNFWTGERVQGGNEFFLPASTDEIPVYVKSGSIVPWADVGLYAGTPESRRITARVYGDGSLPFQFGNGGDSLRLEWSQGAGVIKGARGRYADYAWKKMG